MPLARPPHPAIEEALLAQRTQSQLPQTQPPAGLGKWVYPNHVGMAPQGIAGTSAAVARPPAVPMAQPAPTRDRQSQALNAPSARQSANFQTNQPQPSGLNMPLQQIEQEMKQELGTEGMGGDGWYHERSRRMMDKIGYQFYGLPLEVAHRALGMVGEISPEVAQQYEAMPPRQRLQFWDDAIANPFDDRFTR